MSKRPSISSNHPVQCRTSHQSNQHGYLRICSSTTERPAIKKRISADPLGLVSDSKIYLSIIIPPHSHEPQLMFRTALRLLRPDQQYQHQLENIKNSLIMQLYPSIGLILFAIPLAANGNPLNTTNVNKLCTVQRLDRGCGLPYCCRTGWSGFKRVCCPPGTSESKIKDKGNDIWGCCPMGAKLAHTGKDRSLICSDGSESADPERQCLCSVPYEERPRACYEA